MVSDNNPVLDPDRGNENMTEVSSDDDLVRYKKLYAMLLDAIPSSVLLIDRDMRILSANRYFLEKSRRSPANTIKRRLEEVFPALILNRMKITSQIRQVFEQNQPVKGQRMSYRVPGIPIRTYYYTILPFSKPVLDPDRGPVLDPDRGKDVVESVMLLMVDVTDKVRLNGEVRRVERYLASVVESASDIILSTDLKGKISTWNPAAERVSGYTFDEVKGCPFFDYCTEDKREEMEGIFFNMKTKNKSRMAEGDLITKGNECVQVSWVFSPMKDDLSKTVGVVALGRDLSEQRKFEMQFFQSQKLTALGVMAGGIAHEIRNPLAIGSSSAQFLMDDDITPEFRRECANKIHEAIHRASFIIENLLKFARAPVKTDMVKINLLSLIQETLTLVSNQAKIQNIGLSTHFPNKAVFINGNTTLLQQMLMNLFLNAIDAMPEGGSLSIRVKRMEGEVLVIIADKGRGISKEQIDKIFDPFYTTSPVGKGTGLGLSICYSIAKQHFGSIEVDSVKGKGSTFTVRLPIL